MHELFCPRPRTQWLDGFWHKLLFSCMACLFIELICPLLFFVDQPAGKGWHDVCTIASPVKGMDVYHKYSVLSLLAKIIYIIIIIVLPSNRLPNGRRNVFLSLVIIL